MGDDLKELKAEMKLLLEQSNELAKSTGDERAQTAARQLQKQYDNLCEKIEDSMDQAALNTEEHRDYCDKTEAVKAWLAKAASQLLSVESLEGSDKDTVQTKLEQLKVSCSHDSSAGSLCCSQPRLVLCRHCSQTRTWPKRSSW